MTEQLRPLAMAIEAAGSGNLPGIVSQQREIAIEALSTCKKSGGSLREYLRASELQWALLRAEKIAGESSGQEPPNQQLTQFLQEGYRQIKPFQISGFDEKDISPENLFRQLKMIAHQGICTMQGKYGVDTFYAISEKTRYVVSSETHPGGDTIRVKIYETDEEYGGPAIRFTICDEPWMESAGGVSSRNRFHHYGGPIPPDILTRLLDSQFDLERAERAYNDYLMSFRRREMAVRT